MYERKELYNKFLEFLIGVNHKLQNHDISGFIDGMQLGGHNISADPTIWIDWVEMTPEYLEKDQAHAHLLKFFAHWIKKYHMRIFNILKYKMDPSDFDHDPDISSKWTEIFG